MKTMRWTRFLAAGLVLVAGWGCSQATAPEEARADALVPVAQEVTLRLGEEKPVGSSVVRIQFGRVVEDSRCPVDELILCVWEGRGVVELGIRAGMGPTHGLTVETREVGRTAHWNGLRVTLLELTPAARLNPPIDPTAYTVKLRVEPDGR